MNNNTLKYLETLQNVANSFSEIDNQVSDAAITLDLNFDSEQKNSSTKPDTDFEKTTEQKSSNTQLDIPPESPTFTDLFNSFYSFELKKFIASLASKNVNKFRLSEISECLLKILYSKHSDVILTNYRNLLNVDDLYYILNLHAIKGTSTHSYIQEWLKKSGIQNYEVETRIEHIEDGITLVGRTDILIHSDEPYVVEMKSSSKYSDYHQLQLQLQMYILNKNKDKYLNGKEVTRSYLWYYFTRKYYIIKYDEDYVRNFMQYLKILKSILQSNSSLEFIIRNYKTHVQKLKTNNTENCISCVYRNICSMLLQENK